MKLFYSPKTRANRPRWMLEELGVPYDLVHIDLKKGDHKKPDYLKINPMGYVPSFQDGDTTFYESGAIVAYLADKYADKKLAPALNVPERGKYYQWMFFSLTALDVPIVGVFYHTQLLPEAERIPAYVEYCKNGLAKAAPVLSSHLKENSYILGQEFSAADIMLASNLAFAKALKLIDDEPVLLDYANRMTSRPAFQRAIA